MVTSVLGIWFHQLNEPTSCATVPTLVKEVQMLPQFARPALEACACRWLMTSKQQTEKNLGKSNRLRLVSGHRFLPSSWECPAPAVSTQWARTNTLSHFTCSLLFRATFTCFGMQVHSEISHWLPSWPQPVPMALPGHPQAMPDLVTVMGPDPAIPITAHGGQLLFPWEHLVLPVL